MKKARVRPWMAWIVMIWLTAPLCVAAETPQPVLRVGIDESYAPYEYMENGTARGFNVDLVRAVLAEMGYKPQFIAGPWPDTRTKLTSGDVDMLAGMFWSESRDQQIDFGVPHSAVSKAVFVRTDSTIQNIQDIYDTEIMVQRGDILHDWALEQNISATIVPVDTPTSGLILLASGQHDCLLLPKYQGEYFITRLNLQNIVALHEPLTTDNYSFAVLDGNYELLLQLNEGLSLVQETGQYDEIYREWFSQPTYWYDAVWVRYAAYGLAGSLGLLIVVMAMNLSLRRRVHKQTDALVRELAEREQAQASLEIYANDLEKSNRELGIFSYAASHDLQAPLRKIQAFCTRIRETQIDALDEQGIDYLDRTERSAEKMQGMLQNLLAYASISPGERLYHRTDLDDVLADATAELELQIDESQAIIEAEPLPAVEGDAELLRHVFANLISNSIKFAQARVRPHIWISSETTDSEAIVVVQDNGIGFDNAYAHQVFGLFQRLHGQSQYAGHGMGLAICRKIIELHHGTIKALGIPDEGATFTITLPLVQPRPQLSPTIE